MYYVYELVITPDEKVCYVGKGKNLRMYAHRKNLTNRSYSQSGLYRRLRELAESGKDFYPRKVFESVYEEECLKEEHRRIMEYGFDKLFNSTSIPGRRETDVTDALRQAMSKAQKEKAERNRKLYGTGLPPEHIAKISASGKKAVKPADIGDRISRSKKGTALTTKHRLALRIRHKIDPETEKTRAATCSEKMKRLWAEGKMRGNTGCKNPRLKGTRKRFLSILRSKLQEQV